MHAKNSLNADKSTTRREFATALGAIGAVAMLPQNLPAKNKVAVDDPIEIIDTHQHLWDLQKFELKWLKGNKTLDRSFVTEDYLKATEGLNVKRAVYMEVDVVPEQQTAEAEYIVELCKEGKTPTVAGVIGRNILNDDFGYYVKPFVNNPYVKGVRHILANEKGDSFLRYKEILFFLRFLGDTNLRFDLCVRPDQLLAGAKLAQNAPKTKFVLDHCGNADYQAFMPESKRFREPDHKPEVWKKGIAEIAKQKNVVCKLSGIIAKVKKGEWKPEELAPIVDHCIDCFGEDRVMFASDWPVCLLGAELREWVAALKELTAKHGVEAQRKIFAANAAKFYELDK